KTQSLIRVLYFPVQRIRNRLRCEPVGVKPTSIKLVNDVFDVTTSSWVGAPFRGAAAGRVNQRNCWVEGHKLDNLCVRYYNKHVMRVPTQRARTRRNEGQ